MVATLALALLLNGPIEPRLAVHLSIDQSGGLSAVQLQLMVEEVRKVWSDARVNVTSARYGEPLGQNAESATISLRILLMPPPVKDGAERILAWVTRGAAGGLAPLLFVSLSAVTETVLGTEAFDRPVKKLTRALRDRLIAQAIGRVTAHELGHYLLNAGHQDRGLMRPSIPRRSWLETGSIPSRCLARSDKSFVGRSRRWHAFRLLLSSSQSLTAWSGSAFVAARAGIQLAAMATRPSTAAADTNTSGSVALTSNNNERSTRVAA